MKFNLLFLFSFLLISFFGNSQSSSPLGTWNTIGLPNYLTVADTISETYVTNLLSNGGVLDEQHNNSAYVDVNEFANLVLIDTTEVWVTFMFEGAGYYNALGFYTYPTGNPPASVSNITNKAIIFANASGLGANSSANDYRGGGGLALGDKVFLGEYPANTTIGWYVIANGWVGSVDTVGNGYNTFYSNHNLNPESDVNKKPHNIFMWDAVIGKYLLSFEDIRRDGGADNDFNDCVFFVTTIEKATGIPLPPPSGVPEVDETGRILPVELIKFEGKVKDGKVNLYWETASEVDCDYFIVQQSKDGYYFSDIDKLDGAGNSNILISYNSVDYTPFTGYTYYRLKQLDYNGLVNYSKIIAVNIIHNTDQIVSQVFPNPAIGNYVSLVLDQDIEYASIDILNTAGFVVKHFELNSQLKGSIPVEVSDLSAGFYTIRIEDGNNVQLIKFIKQ
jgi:hypothetical protein